MNKLAVINKLKHYGRMDVANAMLAILMAEDFHSYSFTIEYRRSASERLPLEGAHGRTKEFINKFYHFAILKIHKDGISTAFPLPMVTERAYYALFAVAELVETDHSPLFYDDGLQGDREGFSEEQLKWISRRRLSRINEENWFVDQRFGYHYDFKFFSISK